MALVFRHMAATQEGSMGFIEGVIMTCKFVGDLFMGLLKMIIVPLVASSVIAGISSLHGVKGFGRLLSKTAGFYAMTSLLAISLGLLLVNSIQPGLDNGQPNEVILNAFESMRRVMQPWRKLREPKSKVGNKQGFSNKCQGSFCGWCQRTFSRRRPRTAKCWG